MDYTTSDANVVHVGTGHRMHQQTEPVPTAVSSADMNSVIWSLMAIVEAAGLTPRTFDPDDPTSYRVLLNALTGLQGFSAIGAGPGMQTLRLQDFLDDNLLVYIGAGTFNIDDELDLRDDHVIVMNAGTKINQTAVNKAIFKAFQKNRIVVLGGWATLTGEGTWSPAWTGNGGHDDRGFFFIGCNDCVIDSVRLQDFGHSGVALTGGTRNKLTNLAIKGTHNLSTALPYQANFQPGIYLKNDPTYGAVDELLISNVDISDCAFGVLDELEVGATQRSGMLRINNANIHDIPGQHAFYLTSRNYKISATISDIALAGVKIQAGDANQVIGNLEADIVASNLPNSQMFELATPPGFTGKVVGAQLRGLGKNVARGISIARRVEGVRAVIDGETVTSVGVNMQGDENHDIDITFRGRDIGMDAFVCTATASDAKVRLEVRNPNTTNTVGSCGVRVDSPSMKLELTDLDIVDSNGRMQYGLFNAQAGSDIKVRGRVRLTGASDTAVRATGVISEFPTEAVLQGTNGAFTNQANVKSSQPMLMQLTTTANANAFMWGRNMVDNSTLLVTVTLTCTRPVAGGDKGSWSFTGVFTRTGGGAATIIGAVATHFNQATGGFVTPFVLQANGNSVELLVNPNTAVATDWTARVTAVESL